jgi:putative methyltransferase (TIGR04325 family)
VNNATVLRTGSQHRSSDGILRQAAKSLLTSPGGKAIIEWTEGWLPPLRLIHKRIYEREFARIVPFARRFCGAYATFEEAIKAAPAAKPIGYDNPDAATLMAPSGPLWLSDYPVLFWLEKALAESPSVLDIGGYVGISYYSYRDYLTYPQNLQWLVYDVPAVAAVGVEIARRENSVGLSFTSELDGRVKAHTVLASGALQFIEQDCANLLSKLAVLPEHLIISKTPLTDLEGFVTLQDLGPAVCPYWIFNRKKFIDSIQSLGYRLIDSWANVEFSCDIPFHPERCVPGYTGLYFRAEH